MSDRYTTSFVQQRATPAERARQRIRNRARAASKVAAVAARLRHKAITAALRPMVIAGLGLSDMARELERRDVLTPRGHPWWTARQVQAALRFALYRYRGIPPATKASYLGKAGPLKGRKMNKVRQKSKTPGNGSWKNRGTGGKWTNVWLPAPMPKVELPGGTGYFSPKRRRRSKVTKVPPKSSADRSV